MIIAKNLSIGYNKKYILEDANFQINKNEIFAIMGTGGSGKSTLLKTIAGLIKPVMGKILIDKTDINNCKHKTKKEILRKMGMVFQQGALFDSMTVEENITFPISEKENIPQEKLTERAKKILIDVGLDGTQKLYPDELSGGMQKRVAIARAISLSPEIILYDDPTAGLDPITSKDIINLIIKLNKQHKSTIIIATGDVSLATKIADNIGIILNKKIIIDSGNKIAKNRDKAVQQFIKGELKGPINLYY